MRVPSTPPLRTSATSVVPPPTSMNSAPDWPHLLAVDAARHGVRLGHDASSSRSSACATLWSAPRWISGRERVEDADAHVAALEADRVGDRVAVDGAPVTAAWTRRTSTVGRPVSQVMVRSASWSASRWTPSMSF